MTFNDLQRHIQDEDDNACDDKWRQYSHQPADKGEYDVHVLEAQVKQYRSCCQKKYLRHIFSVKFHLSFHSLFSFLYIDYNTPLLQKSITSLFNSTKFSLSGLLFWQKLFLSRNSGCKLKNIYFDKILDNN